MTLAFVPMQRGTKKPMRKDWNKRENCLFGDDALNQLAGCNAALALAYCEYESAACLHMNPLMEGEKNPWEAQAIHRGGSTNDYGEYRPDGNQKDSDGQ